MLPFGVTIPATVPQRSEIPEGLMNYPVYIFIKNCFLRYRNNISQCGGKKIKSSTTNVGWGDYEECYLRIATLGSTTVFLDPCKQ